VIQIQRTCVWEYLYAACADQKHVNIDCDDLIVLCLVSVPGELELLSRIQGCLLLDGHHGLENVLREVSNRLNQRLDFFNLLEISFGKRRHIHIQHPTVVIE